MAQVDEKNMPGPSDMDNVGSCDTCLTQPQRERIATENVSCAPPDDPAAIVGSRKARFLIFLAFCQGVQCFMSYDGGATPASLDTIQVEMDGAWTPMEFGILGAMDKIGMTLTSVIWGRGLQLCAAKPLLTFGLALNAACTFAFGMLRNKNLMYTAKFFMGATQSLQGVWGTVWTVTMAPPDQKTTWLGLGAVSAGLGNGLGTGIAGFGTANGLSYAFAFQLQAGVLVLLLIMEFLTPMKRLALSLPKEAQMGMEETVSDAPPPMGVQARTLWKNGTYVYTVLSISYIMFVVSGIQFIWVRLYVEVWGLTKNWVTLMFLVVTALGAGSGIAFGPAYIDKRGGFETPPGVYRSLTSLAGFGKIAAVAGVAGTVCLFGKLRLKDDLSDWGDHWLWLNWACIVVILALLNGAIPALCGINCQVVQPEMRTMGSGLEMTVRNILGFAFGPLLPGVLMSLLESVLGWDSTDPVDLEWQLCYGMMLILLMCVPGCFALIFAASAAKKELDIVQLAAMKEVQAALMAQDMSLLKKAIKTGKAVELQSRMPDGASVMATANEISGSGFDAKPLSMQGLADAVIGEDKLNDRIKELMKELEAVKAENVRITKERDNLLQPATAL